MILFLKALLGLIGVLLLYLSANWLFNPAKIMNQHDIQASSPTGYNFLRGDIGGILLSGAIFVGLFLYQGGDHWMHAGIILLSAVILGRLISLISDGQSKQGLQAIIVEFIMIVLLLGIKYLE